MPHHHEGILRTLKMKSSSGIVPLSGLWFRFSWALAVVALVHELGARTWICRRSLFTGLCSESACCRCSNARDHMIHYRWKTDVILPDLQSAVLCEDIRCEINGMRRSWACQCDPATCTADQLYRFVFGTAVVQRGTGKFRQKSRIVGVDEQQVNGQAES